MSEIVLKNAFVSLDGNDISAHVKSVTINYNAEMLDKTAMGDDSRNKLGGLKDFSATVECHADFAAAALDSIMFPLVGETVAMVVRPDAGAVSTSNPQYTKNVVVEGYPPLGGGVGGLASSSIGLQSGDGLLPVRATA